jgi:hypothetical protein
MANIFSRRKTLCGLSHYTDPMDGSSTPENKYELLKCHNLSSVSLKTSPDEVTGFLQKYYQLTCIKNVVAEIKQNSTPRSRDKN